MSYRRWNDVVCLLGVAKFNRSLETNWLTLSWRRPLSYRKQSIDLPSKSMDWFLYDNGLRHEKVKRGCSPFQPRAAFHIKPVIWFGVQHKCLVSLWNAILGWSGLSLAAAKVLFFKKVLFFYRKLSMYYLLFKFASVVLFANIFMNLSIYHTCIHIPQKAIK